jgi:hypothetical protein
MADMNPYYRSSLVPPAVSSSVAPPWPSSTPVTPTSCLPRLLKCMSRDMSKVVKTCRSEKLRHRADCLSEVTKDWRSASVGAEGR